MPFPANAFNALSTISASEIDILWVYFGASPSEDALVVQEVKTTEQMHLGLADGLRDDIEKLFGTKPKLTLRCRLDHVRNVLEYQLGKKDLCSRVIDLAGKSPQTSLKTSLVPTLVHDRLSSDSITKMVGIRTTICGKGWDSAKVEAWAIGLFDLQNRLMRLSAGQN
jgi:hypothetical protein